MVDIDGSWVGSVIMFKEVHFIDCIAREMLCNVCCSWVCSFPLSFGLTQDFASLWISILVL